MEKDSSKLTAIFSSLGQQQRSTLLEFASFLMQKQQVAGDKPQVQKPENIDRPETETVVNAIKRLSKTYSMLNRKQLLDKTSVLMSAHMIEGRQSVEVIDDLEDVFSQQYEKYLQERQD